MTRRRTVGLAVLTTAALLWLALAWRVEREPAENAALPAPDPQPMAAEPSAAPQPATPVPPAAAPVEAPAQEAPPEIPAAGDQHLLVMDAMFSQPQGPLEAFRQTYQTEPRDSAANDAEARVRAAFEPEQASSHLLRAVLCRRTVCRLELSWRGSELGSYVAAMRRTDADFEQEIAAVELPGAGRVVEVYLRRKE
jgi:hypothetical protein